MIDVGLDRYVLTGHSWHATCELRYFPASHGSIVHTHLHWLVHLVLDEKVLKDIVNGVVDNKRQPNGSVPLLFDVGSFFLAVQNYFRFQVMVQVMVIILCENLHSTK